METKSIDDMIKIEPKKSLMKLDSKDLKLQTQIKQEENSRVKTHKDFGIRKDSKCERNLSEFFECFPQLEELDLGLNEFHLVPNQFLALKNLKKLS
jgi:hypothetical protein